MHTYKCTPSVRQYSNDKVLQYCSVYDNTLSHCMCCRNNYHSVSAMNVVYPTYICLLYHFFPVTKACFFLSYKAVEQHTSSLHGCSILSDLNVLLNVEVLKLFSFTGKVRLMKPIARLQYSHPCYHRDFSEF